MTSHMEKHRVIQSLLTFTLDDSSTDILPPIFPLDVTSLPPEASTKKQRDFIVMLKNSRFCNTRDVFTQTFYMLH